jgi:FSR family fosmidomycin resistance protein-like MFS transporter
LWYYYPSGHENDEHAKGARICPEDPQMANITTFPRINVTKVALLSLGHLVVDLYPSFLAALLPLLIERLRLSMSLASLLASILMFSAALSQPVFGILSDRIGGKMLMLWGAMMAAAGMSFIGLLPSYALLLPFLILGGLGVACFHPQAAALAGHFSGPRKGLGLSLFMLGGNIGYGLGPLVILAIVLGLGLKSSYLALFPGAIFLLLLARYLPKDTIPLPTTRDEGAAENAVVLRDLAPFAFLWLIVWLRSTAILSLATFLPTLQTMRGLSLVKGGSSFTVFMICGAIGGFIGGSLSDRVGRKNMVILSFLLVIPAFYGFLHVTIKWTFFSLAALGFFFFLGESPCIVMAQEAVPGRGGTMSALIMGFTWGMAALGVFGTGYFADILGMERAMGFLLYLPATALVLTLFLSGKQFSFLGIKKTLDLREKNL